MPLNPRGDTVVRWVVAIGVIDALAVVLRLWVRKRNGTKIAADDWMVIASLVPAFFMIATASICVSKGGLGRHRADVTDAELTTLLKCLIPATMTYGLTITAVKISILLLYRRVFGTVAKFKRATLIVGILCITWLCGNTFTQIFLCSPMSAAWNPNVIFSKADCRDLHRYLVGITAANLLLDIVILCMPLPMIWDLNLSTRKKFEVSGVFLLGSFTCISSLLRILSIGSIKDEDVSYTILNTYLWSHVEPATAIACACLMTYGPLFAGVSPRLQSFIGGSKQNLFTKRLINIKLGSSSTGSDSEASQSLGRTMHGQEPADYGGGGGDLLGAKIPKGTAAHGGFNVSVKALSADSRSSSSATEHLSMNPAVGRDSSLV